MYSTRGLSRHAIPRLPAGGNRVQIVQSPETHGVTSFAGSAADMRQQESVVEFPVARVDIRLAVEDVETGRRHVARAQRLLQGPSSSMRAPRALLTTIAPGRSKRMRSASKRLRVAGVAGQCRESTSQAASRVSSRSW